MTESKAIITLIANRSNADDFKPFETRVLHAGQYEVKAIRPKGAPENRLAWRSWADPFPEDWQGKDCDQQKKGWTTDFYISVLDLHTNEIKPVQQFTSARCRTKEIAVQNAEAEKFTLENLSIVTFFLSAKFDDNRYHNYGGLYLSLRKI